MQEFACGVICGRWQRIHFLPDVTCHTARPAALSDQ